ncbi:MAG TPA: hypothetical protein VGP19_06545 [Candidatus Acidoferrales bacterium]|jgi:hypothetical protein|nr:hypothetical protein [Candidatus Acidoferrales bacterium]
MRTKSSKKTETGRGRAGRVPKELPIERIFEKVVGRKMTPAEKPSFHRMRGIGSGPKRH